MAGIVYRTCEFDDRVGAAVAAYQEAVSVRHRSLRTTIQALKTQLGTFTDLQDLDDLLSATMNAFGISDRDNLRRRFGLPARPSTTSGMEEWLLTTTGMVIINGRYMMHDPNGVDVEPYRQVYSKVGLSPLEQALSASGDGSFQYFIEHDSVVYSNVPPKQLSSDLGIPITDFDSILFLWVGSPNNGAKSLLSSQGFDSASIARIVKSQSAQNLTVLTVPRVDFFTQLRAMGLTDADIVLLLERPVEAVTIDSGRRRRRDSEESTAEPYQTTPYPGEIANALRAELGAFPSIGEASEFGARTYIPAVAVVLRVIDIEKTFGITSFMRRTSDKIGPGRQTGQAMLSGGDVQSAEYQASLGEMQSMSDQFIEQGALTEETMLVFGVDSECGVFGGDVSGDGASGASLFGGGLLSFDQQLALDNLGSSFSTLTSNMNFAGDLLGGIAGSFLGFSCEIISFSDCQSKSMLPDLGGDGGPFDFSGATNSALSDLNSVFQGMDELFQAFEDIPLNFSVNSAISNDLTAFNTQPCQSADNSALLTGISEG